MCVFVSPLGGGRDDCHTGRSLGVSGSVSVEESSEQLSLLQCLHCATGGLRTHSCVLTHFWIHLLSVLEDGHTAEDGADTPDIQQTLLAEPPRTGPASLLSAPH